MSDIFFDPNEGAFAGGWRLPELEAKARSADEWVRLIESRVGTNMGSILGGLKTLEMPGDPLEAAMKALPKDKVEKALSAAPSAFTFAKISYMPDAASNKGVVQWPGYAPDALAKIARENIAPQLIIGTQLWKPGWRFESMDGGHGLSEAEKSDARDAARFLMNSNIETGNTDVRKRDAYRLRSFSHFLSAAVRDSLTYDGIAVYTDLDSKERVRSYSLLPAGQIRFATEAGYNGNPEHFAVGVDEGGRVVHLFTRDQLTYYVRNPRTQPDIASYGYPEIEIAVRLIMGFQNALDVNIDTFTRNGTPNGILVLSGSQITPRQLDLLNRLWTNLKKGVTKAWALPVMGLQGDGKLELLDLSRLKGNELYYKEFLNLLAGAFCTVWRFPVRRLGYHASGQTKDNAPLPSSGEQLVDEDDPGLEPLLSHLEELINSYLIHTRWPHLKFVFCGKSPKQAAREYEFRRNAMTFKEARAEAGLKSLEEIAEGEEQKKLAKVMDLAPIDSNLSGVYQTVAGQSIAADEKNVDTPGGEMREKKDPAASETHGHAAGVRRDSSSEGK